MPRLRPSLRKGLPFACGGPCRAGQTQEETVGAELKLVGARLGGAEGKLWWFNDPVKGLPEAARAVRESPQLDLGI